MTGRTGRSWMPPRLVGAGIVVLTIGWAGYLAWVVRVDPRVPFLTRDACGDWIVPDAPIDLAARREGFYRTHFRTWLDAGPSRDAVLTLRALRMAEVVLDGRPVFTTGRDFRAWKQRRQVPLHLDAGMRHELVVTVMNENGPPALLACAPAIGVASGPGWATREGRDDPWKPAILAGPRPAELSRRFMRADDALLAVWPALVALLLGGAVVTIAVERAGVPLPSPAVCRWLLVGAWLVLAANDAPKLPLWVGFDGAGHLEYIRYLAAHWRVPLATEGWQMFQPPLYHALSALLVWMPARPFLDEETTMRLLRIVPLACGVAQVELAYRAARHVFPERADLQRLGTVLGGLLPINLYASQYIGNEPLTGCLTAGVVVLLLGWLRTPAAALGMRAHWLLGILLGLAMLAKPTVALVVVPGLLVLALAHAQVGERPARFVRAGTRAMVALGLVAGWYYVRNWILLGTPFVGGWDASRGIGWWQEPGYRVAAHVVSFGEAMRYPVFGGVVGLWDAEYSTLWLDGWLSSVMEYDYRPPWNYALLLPAPWLALVPTAAIVVGAASIPWQIASARRGLTLAAGLVALYLLATLSLYLQVPIYAAAKATQLLGLTPCFAVLGAAGFGVLGGVRVLRPLLVGAMACWASAAYLAYFVW